jgi:hypothetical protein
VTHPPAHDTHQKALAINLDPTTFGSFAEIGAGQEVARWFLRVGGASGTVAKTISAYGKEISDDLYGGGTRYVSRQRLEDMIECEWKALRQQVGETRGESTRLFVFADTAAARNFAGTNDCHGWVGVRFQERPHAEPRDVLLHVNLRDQANVLQQEALGVLGVNLLHALLLERVDLASLPARLFEGLAEGRIEVDQVAARGGPAAAADLPALHLELARDGRAEAAAFTAEGDAVAANELLYGKGILIVPVAASERESLPAVAVESCLAALRREAASAADPADVMILHLLVLEPGGQPAAARPARGPLLATRHRELYRTTAFIRRYTGGPLRFALALPALVRIFDGARYQELEGRILEALARLFAQDVRVLAYPGRRDAMGRLLAGEGEGRWTLSGRGAWLTAGEMRPGPPLRFLYEYLLASGFLVSLSPQETPRAEAGPSTIRRHGHDRETSP